MSWWEYGTLAGELEAHRAAEVRLADTRTEAVEQLRGELTAAREALSGQSERIATLYRGVGLNAPVLSAPPVGSDRPSAAVPDVDRLRGELVGARELVDRVSAQLAALESEAEQPPVLPGWPVGARNGLVYAVGAVLAFLVGIATLFTAESPSAWSLVPVYLLLPLAAFALCYLAIGLLFRPATGGDVPRTRALGLIVCYAPLLLVCGLSLLH